MERTNKNYKIEAIGEIQLVECLLPSIKQKCHEQEALVDRIWERALQQEGDNLKNEELLHFVALKTEGKRTTIYGHFIRYKYFFAQRRQRNLNIGTMPIGVSGVTLLEKNDDCWVVFAQRESHVTEYPGFFELVPSGSLDREVSDSNGVIDYQSKLLSEFVEETGLSKTFVKDICGFAFIFDQNHNVFDVCCKITLEAENETIIKAFSNSEEYTKPVLISTNKLGRFLYENSDRIVPTSLAILEVSGLRADTKAP
jgi:hypothetical protein